MRIDRILLTFLLLPAVSACAQDVPVKPAGQQPASTKARAATPQLPPDRNKHALIVSGISGEEGYAQQFSGWTAKLKSSLIERLGFAADQIVILTEKPAENGERATAETVRQALVRWRNTLKPDNQAFIFMIGHGSFDGKISKFNLVGPDLAAEDYALLIDALPANRIVIVNMASASGEFIKPLARDGRIVITATRSGMEQNAPKFAEYFIRALENPEADLDKNGRISALEAFEYATQLTAKQFEQSGKLATEHALIDDNGDGVGHPKAEAGDGGLARVTYFDSLPQQQAGGDPVLAKLFEERMRMEGAIEQLKARKGQMKPEEYESNLETMLIDLAKVSQSIRAKQKK